MKNFHRPTTRPQSPPQPDKDQWVNEAYSQDSSEYQPHTEMEFSTYYNPNKGLLLTLFKGICKFTNFVVFVLMIATLAVVVDISNKNSNALSTLRSGNEQMQLLRLVIEENEATTSVDGMSIKPYPVCINHCKKEFCFDIDPSETCSNNMCQGLSDVTYQTCVDGCLCADSYTICLLTKSVTECQEALPDCNFEAFPYPPFISPICYGTKTTINYEYMGVGFNTPVPVESS